MSIRQRALMAAAVAAAAVGLAARTAPAGITVSPLKQDIALKPGGTATFHVTVANRARTRGAPPQSARLQVTDFEITERGAVLLKPPGTVEDSATAWITPTHAAVTLKPNQSERIDFEVKAPYTATGEYYAAVVVVLDRKQTHGTLEVEYRIASGVYVTVQGRTFPKKAKVLRCEVGWLGPDGALPKSDAAPMPAILAVLKNTGRSRFDASGHLRISNAEGRTVFKAPMTTRRPSVLAGDTRLFECPLTKVLPCGLYTMRVEFDHQSGWTKAQARVPLMITAEQEALLAKAAAAAVTATVSGPTVKVEPKALAAKLPAGTFRVLKVDVTNTGGDSLQCRATVADPSGARNPASWFQIRTDTFTLATTASKTLHLFVRVPDEAAGHHETTLVLEIDTLDAAPSRIEVPIDLTVQGRTG
ncbi:MAG TPA: hypothetical protein VM238_11670 [Phycisphaerae bacterium]|nr:hypothetical protein [Phycisphaerae bacterium]